MEHKVISGTSVIHAETFAQALGWDVGVPSEGWAFLTGVSPETAGQIKKIREKGVKVAGYWIGSDSMVAFQDERYRGALCELDAHLCVHERIQDELRQWGVESHVVYPCARNFSHGEPPPKEPLVGVYMPTTDQMYMFNQTVQVAEENPLLKFLFYGMKEYPKLPENVIDSGRMTPEEVGEKTKQISVMLRLCAHDGFPVGGIEAKMKNRHVIENFPYPGFLYAPTMERVNEYLRDTEVHKGDNGPWPAWYREQCSPQRFKENVYRCIELET